MYSVVKERAESIVPVPIILLGLTCYKVVKTTQKF